MPLVQEELLAGGKGFQQADHVFQDLMRGKAEIRVGAPRGRRNTPCISGRRRCGRPTIRDDIEDSFPSMAARQKARTFASHSRSAWRWYSSICPGILPRGGDKEGGQALLHLVGDLVLDVAPQLGGFPAGHPVGFREDHARLCTWRCARRARRASSGPWSRPGNPRGGMRALCSSWVNPPSLPGDSATAARGGRAARGAAVISPRARSSRGSSRSPHWTAPRYRSTRTPPCISPKALR